MRCAICRTSLPKRIDQYGDLDFILCQTCFFWEGDGAATWPQMFTCTHYPDGSIGCRMTDAWREIEDALEAIRPIEEGPHANA